MLVIMGKMGDKPTRGGREESRCWDLCGETRVGWIRGLKEDCTETRAIVFGEGRAQGKGENRGMGKRSHGASQ